MFSSHELINVCINVIVVIFHNVYACTSNHHTADFKHLTLAAVPIRELLEKENKKEEV